MRKRSYIILEHPRERRSAPVAVRFDPERVAWALYRKSRHDLVAEAAYFRAERRGFGQGSAERDWAEAEAEIEALLRCRGRDL